MGIMLIPYIDDFLFFTSSVQEFASVQAQVLADFMKAGFFLSLEKCQLQASHVVKFLGFVIDSLHGVFCLSSVQKKKIIDSISSCLATPSRVSAKLLARTTGLITLMSLVTGPVSGLFSRFLHRALNTKVSWRSSVVLDSAALEELRFWQDSLEKFSSRPIWRPRSLIMLL
jgi:hypothetical protein